MGKIRTACYVRTSTEREEQEGSFALQKEYFTNMIKNDPELEFVGCYGDFGKSGRSVEKRPEFQRMIKDCEEGKIEVIYTKSVSRFARNIADLAETVQHLRQLGVGVYFEREGLNTMERGTELLMNILGIIAQLTGWYHGISVIPDFSNYTVFAPVQSMAENTFCKFDFAYVVHNGVNFAVIVFAFLFVDLFDTVGTLIGVAQEGKLLNEKGELPRVGRALMSDALGTVGGSILGTSTVTSYVESTTGVAEGGKTGLTALTSAVLFLLALPLYPIFLAIPSFATTPALVFVGLLMIKNVTKMDFDSDIADTVGGFFAIITMPFTYSIANGIMLGIITWVILKVITGKIKDIHPVMWVSFALFVVRIVTIVLGVSS